MSPRTLVYYRMSVHPFMVAFPIEALFGDAVHPLDTRDRSRRPLSFRYRQIF